MNRVHHAALIAGYLLLCGAQFCERLLNSKVIDLGHPLLEKDGCALLYHPLFNYEHGNLDHVKTMLDHPYTFGRRLVQKAVGYEATVISGKVAFRHGESTGQLNGKLLRGCQPAPV